MNAVLHLLIFSALAQIEVAESTSVLKHPDFKDRVIPCLQYLVHKEGVEEINDFYIQHFEVDEKGDYLSPIVFWPQGNALILFEPKLGWYFPDDLYISRRYWDLDTDVVPTREDIGGSTYLICEDDARERKNECMNGDHIRIETTITANGRGLSAPVR
ncbi:MAG: hypothetical protein AAGJ81_10155 [Verrucomicrobiota bacterium]